MEKITEFQDNCIVVKIQISVQHRDNYYEATRRCWRFRLMRARKADFLLGTVKGEVKCVIKVKSCDYVKASFCDTEKENCEKYFKADTNLCAGRKKIAFEGEEMVNDTKYLHKIVPVEYFPGQKKYTYK